MVTSTTRIPKVFLDSSVLFAASRSATGSARDLLVAGILGRAALILSPFVVDETRRNLARKSPYALSFYEPFLTRGLVQVVEPPAALVERAAAFTAKKNAEIVAGQSTLACRSWPPTTAKTCSPSGRKSSQRSA